MMRHLVLVGGRRFSWVERVVSWLRGLGPDLRDRTLCARSNLLLLAWVRTSRSADWLFAAWERAAEAAAVPLVLLAQKAACVTETVTAESDDADWTPVTALDERSLVPPGMVRDGSAIVSQEAVDRTTAYADALAVPDPDRDLAILAMPPAQEEAKLVCH